jgi:MYXO-CTERM domain-containing protein
MAQSRRRERGVARVATSALLVAFGTMVSLTGCASEEGSGGGERLGVTRQGLLCSKTMPCPPDNACVDWTCNSFLLECEAKELIPEGEACKNLAGVEGVCYAQVCCTGCLGKDDSGYFCGPGNTTAQCGAVGQACEDCNKGNTCEVYSCDPQRRSCTTSQIPDGQPCTDNTGACLNGDCCAGCRNAAGNCATGNTTLQCGKSTPMTGVVNCVSCDDNNVCSTDPCTNGVCAAKMPIAGSCDDATVCNGHEVCSGTSCAAGTPLNCNDGKVCTVDSCDPQDGCANVPKEAGTSCDDGNVCNGVSICDGGTTCKPGTALDCDDGNPCTTDSCDAVTGCKNVNNTVDCSDGNLCTLVDKCSGGVCVGSSPYTCDDNNPCTTDTCDPARLCVFSPVQNNTSCNDENDCTPSSSCQAGICQGSGGDDCDDGDPCTKPTCTAQSGCTYPDEDNGTPCVFDKCHINSTCQAGACTAGTAIDCDDGNPCTTDSCDAATGCKYVDLNVGDCSDDDLCTKGDKCTAGECVGTPVTCTAIDDCHTAGECQASTGTCTDPRAAEGTDCETVDMEPGDCNDLGVCIPSGAGGAGGETGAGGAGTGGSMGGEGGEPTMIPIGGEGNEPGTGGMPGEPGTGGKSSTGGSTPTPEAGSGTDEEPEHAFVRDPGGCACSVPGSSNTASTGWLAGLAVLLGLSRRRRDRESGAARVG